MLLHLYSPATEATLGSTAHTNQLNLLAEKCVLINRVGLTTDYRALNKLPERNCHYQNNN